MIVNNQKVRENNMVENAIVRIMKDFKRQSWAILEYIRDNYDLFHDLYLMDKEKGRRAIIKRIQKRNYFGQNYANFIVAELLDHFDKYQDLAE